MAARMMITFMFCWHFFSHIIYLSWDKFLQKQCEDNKWDHKVKPFPRKCWDHLISHTPTALWTSLNKNKYFLLRYWWLTKRTPLFIWANDWQLFIDATKPSLKDVLLNKWKAFSSNYITITWRKCFTIWYSFWRWWSSTISRADRSVSKLVLSGRTGQTQHFSFTHLAWPCAKLG